MNIRRRVLKTPVVLRSLEKPKTFSCCAKILCERQASDLQSEK